MTNLNDIKKCWETFMNSVSDQNDFLIQHIGCSSSMSSSVATTKSYGLVVSSPRICLAINNQITDLAKKIDESVKQLQPNKTVGIDNFNVQIYEIKNLLNDEQSLVSAIKFVGVLNRTFDEMIETSKTLLDKFEYLVRDKDATLFLSK